MSLQRVHQHFLLLFISFFVSSIFYKLIKYPSLLYPPPPPPWFLVGTPFSARDQAAWSIADFGVWKKSTDEKYFEKYFDETYAKISPPFNVINWAAAKVLSGKGTWDWIRQLSTNASEGEFQRRKILGKFRLRGIRHFYSIYCCECENVLYQNTHKPS